VNETNDLTSNYSYINSGKISILFVSSHINFQLVSTQSGKQRITLMFRGFCFSGPNQSL